MPIKSILVVDDSRHLVQVLKSRLESKGYKIFTAYTGQEAIEKAGKETPNLIILDYALPDMDGNEIVKRLKQEETTSKIKIIMISGMKNDLFMKFSADKTVDEFIEKPFTPDQILATIKKLIG